MLARDAERNAERNASSEPACEREPSTRPRCPPNATAFGGAVRRLRRARAESIETLAFTVGLHPTSVSKIERAGCRPRWSTVCDLAAALGLEVSALIEEAETQAAANR
ncbi:MAG TPA: helix-turn-helix transcriptional regulator [Solirubrobacteraceae bacterium]|nr:helix-turn-helix transcriptional regulator [Solirubrobacteraceae bacterium]